MSLLKSLICLSVFFCLTSHASADLIDILLESDTGGTGALIDEDNPLVTSNPTFTVAEGGNGLTLTLGGTSDDPDAVFNGAAGSFGINSAGGGEEPTRIEDAFGETISFTFNQDLELHEVEFDNLNNDEIVTAVIGGTSFSIDDTNTPGSDVFDFGDFAVAAGTAISFSVSAPSGANNGVGFQRIVVHVDAVPEPGSLAILGLGGVCFLGRRRRRQS